jgi:hypothetical protein
MVDKSTGDVAADGYHKYMVNNMGLLQNIEHFFLKEIWPI